MQMGWWPMPNHITNVLTIKGPEADIAAFWSAHLREGLIDFDTVIPMPQCIKDTIRNLRNKEELCGDKEVEDYAIACVSDPDDVPTLPGMRKWTEDRKGHESFGQIKERLSKDPVVVKYGKRALLAAAETGFPGWYTWSCHHWGTKWGSYDGVVRKREPGMLVITFDTAWAPPEPILHQLAVLWPSLTIGAECIDEGGGAYVGTWTNGVGLLEDAEESHEMRVRVYGEERVKQEEQDALEEEEDEEEEAAS